MYYGIHELILCPSGNYVKYDISTPKFPNTCMLIDQEDFSYIYTLGYKVGCVETKGKRSRTKYAKVSSKDCTHSYIHRLVILAPKRLQVDHINGDGLDNRKVNLRIVTNKTNGMNTAKSINNTSGCIGVSLIKSTGKWEANIKVDYKKIHLGTYSCFEEACAARKEAETLYGFHENHGRDNQNK